jgi:SAM-dependent methyltransferase
MIGPMPLAASFLADFKQAQRESWAHFAPLEMNTIPCAAHLARFAEVSRGSRVLDVGCGTGVVAITAARLGADVHGIDLTPALLERAHENSRIAGVPVEWREGDVEELPYRDAEFDFVVSQFAHIFAPRPDLALSEMLRVLRPGGTIAFATWPPEMLVGHTLALGIRYMPALPPDFSSPVLWGDPNIIKERFGNRVKDLVFARGWLSVPSLSPQHFRGHVERTAGPIIKLVNALSENAPNQLQSFRQQFDSIVSLFFRDNIVRQDYLLSRALKLS